MLNSLIITGVATFLMVFLRAIQQQNVIHGHYYLAIITSYGLALAEVALISFVVATGWKSIPFVGTGGAIGVVFAMLIYRSFKK